DFFDSAEWKARTKEIPQLQRTQDIAAVGAERPGLRFDQMEAAMKPVFTAVMNGQTSPRTAVADLDQVTKPLLADLPAAARGARRPRAPRAPRCGPPALPVSSRPAPAGRAGQRAAPPGPPGTARTAPPADRAAPGSPGGRRRCRGRRRSGRRRRTAWR